MRNAGLLFLLALCLFACEDKEEAAFEAFENEDFEQSLTIFKELSSLDPQNWYHLYNIARSLEELGRYNEAITSYGKSLKYNEKANEILIARARCLLKTDYLDGAKTDLFRVLRRDEENFEANYLMGRVMMADNDPWAALSYYNKAIKEDDSDVTLFYHRAIVMGTVGNGYMALRDINYVISQKPDFNQAYFNRGILQMRAGKYAEAIDDFDTAEALEYAPADLYVRRADCKSSVGLSSAACTDYKIASDMDPKHYKKVFIEMCAVSSN
ncbi:MAG: tetratricopeptide repeat protein [Imperialibacter sp.]